MGAGRSTPADSLQEATRRAKAARDAAMRTGAELAAERAQAAQEAAQAAEPSDASQ